jgi:hypothetical protein
LRKRPARKNLLVAVAGCAALLTAARSDPARGEIVFSREHIKVFVRTAEIRVEGSYAFANPDTTPLQQWLFYPFPVDSLHATVESVEVRSSGKDVPFHPRANGVYFCVSLPERGSVVVDVCYEQKCLDSSGCYILKSTARWNAPLEHASFEVHVPNTIELDWMAYEAETVATANGSTVYRFSRDDFMPEKDLCLRWHVRRR